MSAKEKTDGAAAESSRFAGARVADDRGFARPSSPCRSRTCACGGLSRGRRRPLLSRLRRATQTPPTGLLRPVPSRAQSAAASTAPSRSGSADPGAARRCPRPDGQERTAVSGGLGTGVLIGGAPGAERIGEQPEAVPERLPTARHLGDPHEDGLATESGRRLAVRSRPSHRGEPRTGKVP